jgi:ABC-2 type transport system ATP-binding protein
VPAVDVEDLVVDYGRRRAVDHVSFSLDAGQVTALLGRNGAGKTSTVERIEGFYRPTAGRVRVLGLDPVADHRRLVPHLGVMLQRGGVYPRLRVVDALRLFASYYDDPIPPDELLRRLDLEAVRRTPYRRLSGGEQQRLGLALALVGRPRVAFLDEPTAGVDPAGRIVIREVISELADRGATVLLTSHELEEVQRLADRVLILHEGRLVAAGSIEELTRTAGDEEICFAAPRGLDLETLGRRLGALVEEEAPGAYRVHAPATPERIARLTAWLAEENLPLGDLRAARPSLEETFLRLVGEQLVGEQLVGERPPRPARPSSAARVATTGAESEVGSAPGGDGDAPAPEGRR